MFPLGYKRLHLIDIDRSIDLSEVQWSLCLLCAGISKQKQLNVTHSFAIVRLVSDANHVLTFLRPCVMAEYKCPQHCSVNCFHACFSQRRILKGVIFSIDIIPRSIKSELFASVGSARNYLLLRDLGSILTSVLYGITFQHRWWQGQEKLIWRALVLDMRGATIPLIVTFL